MENKTYSKKSYVAVMSISILCLVVIVFSTTYAYFKPKITGEGTPINVVAGKVKLAISEEKITAMNLAPILDDTKDTKAQKNSFSISRTEDSNLGACYSLYLVVDKIGANLQNQYFKYEFDYGADVITGDFSNLVFDEEGKANIPLITNQELSSDNTSNSYTLRLWLSYDPNVDQTSLLVGDAELRTFNGHIYASGVTGACSEIADNE
jgi:hypothetical protein